VAPGWVDLGVCWDGWCLNRLELHSEVTYELSSIGNLMSSDSRRVESGRAQVMEQDRRQSSCTCIRQHERIRWPALVKGTEQKSSWDKSQIDRMGVEEEDGWRTYEPLISWHSARGKTMVGARLKDISIEECGSSGGPAPPQICQRRHATLQASPLGLAKAFEQC